MFKTKLVHVFALLTVPILIGCGGGGGGLGDPGLSNVQVEVGNARSVLIGPDGGTITATGSNGFVYKLTIPASSVLKPTRIALYPVAAIKNLPQGGTINGGVNFSPDGLELLIPATLTIQLPASVDPRKAVPIAYSGNADNLHLDLGTVTGQTITMRVYHFSGTALGNRIITDLLLPNPLLTNTTTDFQRRMAAAFWNSEQQNTSPLADYNLILRNWYDLVVRPKLTTGGAPGSSLRDISRAEIEYHAWLDAILYAQRTLGDPAYNVQPQNSESEPLAVAVIKRWYQFFNDACVSNKNNPVDGSWTGDVPQDPALDASLAIDGGSLADEWHIARAPNGLDTETLLNNLCVKVVIESKSYDGNAPGDFGTVKVKAGFTIDGGTPRHDAPIRVKISGNGTVGTPLGTIINGATFSSEVIWPQGVNPLKIDILATLFEDNGAGGNALRNLAVFDRITKSPAQGLVINPNPVSVSVGQTVTVTASRLDGGPLDPNLLSWAISPPTVATIASNGATATVTGKASGIAGVAVVLGGTNLSATADVLVSPTVLAGTYVGQATIDGDGTTPIPVQIDVTEAGNQVTIQITETDGFKRIGGTGTAGFSATLDFSLQNSNPPLILAKNPPNNGGTFDLTPGRPIGFSFNMFNYDGFGNRLDGGGTKTN